MMLHWARLRKHGPAMIFDWHVTEADARDEINVCAEKEGEQVRRFQTVAYFPDGEYRDVDVNCCSSANGHGDPDNSGLCIYCGCEL